MIAFYSAQELNAFGYIIDIWKEAEKELKKPNCQYSYINTLMNMAYGASKVLGMIAGENPHEIMEYAHECARV